MSQPTAVVRMMTYERDAFRCVRCGSWVLLTFQHRRAVGMGGSKRRPTVTDGLCACQSCNEGFEHRLQREALLNGWKVARFVKDPGLVPVFYPLLGGWHVLRGDGRELISGPAARVLMVDVYGAKYEEWEQAA